jgi:hypothetical protein
LVTAVDDYRYAGDVRAQLGIAVAEVADQRVDLAAQSSDHNGQRVDVEIPNW